MQDAIVVKGRLIGPRNVELEQSVSNANEHVEVIVHMGDQLASENGESIFAFLRRLPAGNRTKDEIDRQITEERDAWGDPG